MRREKEYEPSREETDRCAVMSGYVGKRGPSYILDMIYDYWDVLPGSEGGASDRLG